MPGAQFLRKHRPKHTFSKHDQSYINRWRWAINPRFAVTLEKKTQGRPVRDWDFRVGFLCVLDVLFSCTWVFRKIQIAEPSRAEPSRGGPSRAEASPSRAEPGRAELRRADPSRAEPNRADSSRAVPNRAKPSRTGGDPHAIWCKNIMFYNEFYIFTPPSQNISFYKKLGDFAIKTSIFTMKLIAHHKQKQNHAKTLCFTMNYEHVSNTSVFTMNYAFSLK